MPGLWSLTSVRDGLTVPPRESSNTSERAEGQSCSCCTVEQKLSVDVCSFGAGGSGMHFCVGILLKMLYIPMFLFRYYFDPVLFARYLYLLKCI